jgi:ATPase subunit of ABC transporter with duplicated ATPase domains
MTTQTYFLAMAFGLPLTLLVVAMLAGALYRGDYAKLLDWRQTRSARREAELQRDDLQQMLAALNRYRRERGAPERSLEQVTRHSRMSRLYVETSAPPEHR